MPGGARRRGIVAAPQAPSAGGDPAPGDSVEGSWGPPARSSVTDCAHVAPPATPDDGPEASGPVSGPVRARDRHRACADRLDRPGFMGILRLMGVPSPEALTDQSI